MQDLARRILIIHAGSNNGLATGLSAEPNSNYIIEEVEQGELAAAACERFEPHCVLVNCNLADGEGLKVLSELRRQFGALRFATVLVTDSENDAARQAAVESGAQDYLPRSQFKPELLERVIRSALDKLELERRLHDVTHAAPCAMYTVDLTDGGNLYLSNLAGGLLGYAQEDILRMRPADLVRLVHPDDRGLLQSHIGSLRQASDIEILECDLRVQHKTGRWCWLALRNRIAARDRKGLGTKIAGAASDISHRKQIEDELRESQIQLQMAQEAAGIGTWALDLEAQKLTCSALCVKLYGRDEAAPLFQQVWEEWLHPDDRSRVSEDLDRAKAGVPFETEFRILWPDQSVHWLRSQGKLFQDGGGSRLLGATIDITNSKDAEEELRRSNHDLERFAYVASHDLQEPLRSILSFSELFARRNQGVDSESKQYLHYIREGGQRMQALIADLLTFSRITQAGHEPLEPIDSNEVLSDVLSGLHLAIQETDAQVEASVLPRLTANFEQLSQLLQNLIGNAIKYRGEAKPHIRISALRILRGWQFCVADNGIGFDMTYADRIFEAFKRLHSRDRYAGTGVGLAICKRIVERHGGRIWADSVPGKGSNFYFTISDMAEAGQLAAD